MFSPFGQLLRLVFVLVMCRAATDSDRSDDCGPGYLRDQFDNCVKRFVLPERKACPAPHGGHFRNGEFEIKLGGRMAEFWCHDGWTRVPDFDYAMCMLGVWSRTVPHCVRPGCETLTPTPESLVTQREELGGAIVRFFCVKRALVMDGQPVLGCDGQRWNGTMPVCREPPPPETTTTEATGLTGGLMVHDEGGGTGSAASSRTAAMTGLTSALLISRLL